MGVQSKPRTEKSSFFIKKATRPPITPPTEGCHDPVFYPNPCRNSDFIQLHLSPCDQGSEIHIKIFTLVDWKVLDRDFQQAPVGTAMGLELKDNEGIPLASGLYYVVVTTPQGRTIGKLLILR